MNDRNTFRTVKCKSCRVWTAVETATSRVGRFDRCYWLCVACVRKEATRCTSRA